MVVTKAPQFYFSHDEAEFRAEDLIAGITRFAVDSDGVVSESGEALENFDNVSVSGMSPTKIYKEGGFEYLLTLEISDEFGTQTFEEACSLYVGVKGDANLDGSVDAVDAAQILVYAAAAGAGTESHLYSDTDTQKEAFAHFLADVNGTAADSSLDATDAAAILVYAAQSGSGKDITWDEVLGAA